MTIPPNRNIEWFRAKLTACDILAPHIERKWYRVARELYARIYFSVKGLDIPRISVTDCDHAGIMSSSSTDFALYYYAKNEDDCAVAFVSLRREVMELQSLGWLEVVNELNVRNPLFHLRALKFIEEDPRRLPPQAPQQKRPIQKAKAVHEKERQTIGTNATRTSQQDKERLLKELDANLTVFEKQFLEEYNWVSDKIKETIRKTRLHDELVKRIRETIEQQKNDLLRAAKNTDLSRVQSYLQKRRQEQQHIYNCCLDKLLGGITSNLSALEQKKVKKTLNAQVAKLFKLTTQEKRTQTAGTATMDEVTRELTRLFDKIKSGKGDVKDVRDLSKQYDVFLDILTRDLLKKEKTSSSEAKKHSYSSSKWIGEDMETMIRQSRKISKGKQKQLIELARMMSSSHRKDLMELIEKTGV